MGNFIETSEERNYEVETAQRTLLKNVYTWMALALVITGLTAFYVANSPNHHDAIRIKRSTYRTSFS